MNTGTLSMNPVNLINIKRVLLADSDIIIEEKNSAPSLTAGSSYSLLKGIYNEEYSDNLSFSVGISFSLADGGSKSKTLDMKKNEALRLRSNFNDQQKQTISDLQGLINNISVSKKLLEIYRLQEEAAVFDFEKGTKELELGGITSKDLLDFQISLENTRLSILLNRIEYNLTILQIYRLLGFDLRLLTGTAGGAK
jgi:outer membrane protein TolC